MLMLQFPVKRRSLRFLHSRVAEKDETPEKTLKEGTFVFFIIHVKTSGLVESCRLFWCSRGIQIFFTFKTIIKKKKRGGRIQHRFSAVFVETRVKFKPE